MHKDLNKQESKYQKLLQKAYANAEKRIKNGTLKESDITIYILSYMEESSKWQY